MDVTFSEDEPFFPPAILFRGRQLEVKIMDGWMSALLSLIK